MKTRGDGEGGLGALAGAGGVRSTCYVTEFPFFDRHQGGWGVSFLSLSLSPSPASPRLACLLALHSLYIKPWKTRAEPSQPRAVGTGREGRRERCWERASKEVTSGCGLRLRLDTYVYAQTTGLRRLRLSGPIESVSGNRLSGSVADL